MKSTFLALDSQGCMDVVQCEQLDLPTIYQYTNGGPFQMVEIPAIDGLSPMGIAMLINEEGKLYQLPVNDVATDIMTDLFPFNDFIVGDVLFVRSRDARGRLIEDYDSLTKDQLDWLRMKVEERVH